MSKLPTQAWNKAKISPHILLQTALSKRENRATNDAFWLVEFRYARASSWLVVLQRVIIRQVIYQLVVTASDFLASHAGVFRGTRISGRKKKASDFPASKFPIDLYSPRNDPQPWNDPQIDPEMIPISLHVDPEMIPI